MVTVPTATGATTAVVRRAAVLMVPIAAANVMTGSGTTGRPGPTAPTVRTARIDRTGPPATTVADPAGTIAEGAQADRKARTRIAAVLTAAAGRTEIVVAPPVIAANVLRTHGAFLRSMPT